MSSEGDNEARICMSIQTKTQDEFIGVVKMINKRNDMHAIDLASNELAKSHLRHLAGGCPENVRPCGDCEVVTASLPIAHCSLLISIALCRSQTNVCSDSNSQSVPVH